MFLYVIKCDKCVKIGITGNVEKRLKALQTGNAGIMEVIRTVEIPDDKAATIEANMHKRFAAYNVRSEWFDISVLPIIAEMTDAQIIDCEPKSLSKVLFKYCADELYFYGHLHYLSADFKVEEVSSFANGLVNFKDKSHKPVTIEYCKDRKWRFSTNGLLDDLNEDYKKCLENLNKIYESAKKIVESHEQDLKTLQEKYSSSLRDIDELRRRYESDVQ